MQLLKNLYQIGGDLNGITWAGEDAGFRDANSYALDLGETIVLFDCGCGDTLDQLFANMRYWGLDPGRIGWCFLTHPHLDHAGAAHLLKAKGVRLVAHPYTGAAIAAGDERCCGYLYHKTFVPAQVDDTLRDGETMTVAGLPIRALHFPGHTLGCTAWQFTHDGKRVIVSGDVIGTLNVGYFGWDGSIDFDKTKYIDSLLRFARIDFDVMLSGHGMSHFYMPRRRVEECLNQALIQWR
ncbi:MAG TPA: MBL fold metallo-hydrolase [Candidatus Hydrogenedentes bacterium]|jgi:glyoxylase-like metal-dependent hydrolase (beta-lactamase superfamily II)|nr:MAG: Metallo-beta-lactamase L1 precursor [Candidatus Hydrogenedentes bacterium ADurb.Bin170]HPX86481.1 MBL fold metallo-hydrolase [Candidatus Hydrogenedentota bacterium]